MEINSNRKSLAVSCCGNAVGVCRKLVVQHVLINVLVFGWEDSISVKWTHQTTYQLTDSKLRQYNLFFSHPCYDACCISCNYIIITALNHFFLLRNAWDQVTKNDKKQQKLMHFIWKVIPHGHTRQKDKEKILFFLN